MGVSFLGVCVDGGHCRGVSTVECHPTVACGRVKPFALIVRLLEVKSSIIFDQLAECVPFASMANLSVSRCVWPRHLQLPPVPVPTMKRTAAQTRQTTVIKGLGRHLVDGQELFAHVTRGFFPNGRGRNSSLMAFVRR